MKKVIHNKKLLIYYLFLKKLFQDGKVEMVFLILI